MLFNDGMVGVLIFGGVYASGNFDWGTITLLIFGLVTSTSAMIGAYIGGLLDDRFGSMKTLKISIWMSGVILVFMTSIAPGSILFFVSSFCKSEIELGSNKPMLLGLKIRNLSENIIATQNKPTRAKIRNCSAKAKTSFFL